jgi:hypothetical protein
MTTHAASATATCPRCQAPPTSCAANDSGRNTERMPCVIHFSGNSDAMVRIQSGMVEYWKKTPEMNCSTSATGVTTAGAPRPVRATDEKAIPHSVHAVIPSSATQPNVAHFCAVEGSGRS